jgi:hypothetical protein
MPRLLRFFVTFGSLTLALTHCGGQPKHPVREAAPREEPTIAESVEATEEKSGPDCKDGSCIRCGDATCPKGFFCDESSGKASCQWVPTCTDAVDCTCVKKTVSESCDCTEREGGVYLRCKS